MWYIDQIYTIPKYIKKQIEKINDFLWSRKNTTSKATSSTLNLEGWAKCFRHKHSIDLSKSRTKPNVIKFQQYSLERSQTVWIQLKSVFYSSPHPFKTKTDA